MNRQNIPQYNSLLYNIPVANVIPTGGKLRSFPLKYGMRQKHTLPPLLLSILHEVLWRAIRQMKENV